MRSVAVCSALCSQCQYCPRALTHGPSPSGLDAACCHRSQLITAIGMRPVASEHCHRSAPCTELLLLLVQQSACSMAQFLSEAGESVPFWRCIGPGTVGAVFSTACLHNSRYQHWPGVFRLTKPRCTGWSLGNRSREVCQCERREQPSRIMRTGRGQSVPRRLFRSHSQCTAPPVAHLSRYMSVATHTPMPTLALVRITPIDKMLLSSVQCPC